MGLGAYNIPLFLTGMRLVLALVFPIALVTVIPFDVPMFHAAVAICFLALGLTDMLDGYLARRYQQETLLGKLLDPVADKFLVFSTAVTLVYLQKIFFYWAIVVIARDVFVMGLREVALSSGFSVPVAWHGKLKTLVQLGYLGLVIAYPHVTCAQSAYLSSGIYLLFIISLVITVYSAIGYYRDFYARYAARIL